MRRRVVAMRGLGGLLWRRWGYECGRGSRGGVGCRWGELREVLEGRMVVALIRGYSGESSRRRRGWLSRWKWGKVGGEERGGGGVAGGGEGGGGGVEDGELRGETRLGEDA